MSRPDSRLDELQRGRLEQLVDRQAPRREALRVGVPAQRLQRGPVRRDAVAVEVGTEHVRDGVEVDVAADGAK